LRREYEEDIVCGAAGLPAFVFWRRAEAKKKAIIDIDNGMPNDFNGCKLELTTENAPKGSTWLRVIPDPGDVLVGVLRPRFKIWEGYDVITFDYFNESKEAQDWTLIIYPAKGDYHTRADLKFRCRPGKGSIELDIAGINSNFAGRFNWKKPIDKFHFYGPLTAPIQISSVWLETREEEPAKEKKEVTN